MVGPASPHLSTSNQEMAILSQSMLYLLDQWSIISLMGNLKVNLENRTIENKNKNKIRRLLRLNQTMKQEWKSIMT